MRTCIRHLAVVAALGVALASCSGPNELARESDKALAQGNVERAYNKARSALDKNPHHVGAREALRAAAQRLMDDRKGRILAMAPLDSLAAARMVLDLRPFRLELARYNVVLPADPAFAAQESRLLGTGAAVMYRAGREHMAARRPKHAYEQFLAAQEFVPDYRDAGERAQKAFDEALTKVAILPFENQTGVPGLSQAIGDRVYAEVTPRLERETRFVSLVDRGDVYDRVSVRQLESLPRDEAVAIGRKLAADQVVTGRYHSLKGESSLELIRQTVYRRVVFKDAQGNSSERWDEVTFNAVARERVVTVKYDMDAIDVPTRNAVAHRGDVISAVARIVWTDYRAEGDCSNYQLVPTAWRADQPDKVRSIEKQWSDRFGAWSVPALLEQSRSGGRSNYHIKFRSEFFRDMRKLPVLLGEMPSDQDLALVALDRMWNPVLDVLREVDQRE